MEKKESKAAFFIRRIKEGRLKEMRLQIKWIFGYAGRFKFQMLFYTALGMVETVISLLLGLVSKDLIDIITGRKTGEIVRYFVLMIVFNVVTMLMSQLSTYLSMKISMKVDAEIKADLFSKILVTRWEPLSKYHTGDLLTRWGSDSSQISSGVLNFLPNLVIYIFRFISAFAMIIYFDWTFAIFAFLSLPFSLLLSRTLMKRMIRNNERSAAMGAKMSGFNQEIFANIQTIKAFDLLRLYVQRLKSLQKEYIDMKLDFQKMSIWTSLIMSTVGLAVSYCSYGWGIYRVWSGAITYGTMTMFLGLSGTLTGALSNLTGIVPAVINLTTSAGRLMDIAEMPKEDYSNEEEAKAFASKYSKDGISLEIRDVTYRYATGEENVFENASIEAHPHEAVALVGPSGEGKTTMLRLLLSLVLCTEGEAVVYAGNTEHKDSSIMLDPSVRRMISYVPQGNTMFTGTIAENMRNVKPDASDEEIVDALKKACAWEFVSKLSDGINAPIMERGGGFSEGQAQRLAIARAIIRKSPILLLDEATSALDIDTEKEVLKNIMEDTYPRTCIITTHRPTVLKSCSRVYAIRNKKCEVLSDTEIADLTK
ncbi:MAG: ATP-binding cassette domain-containing protein [Lachnospiraceae bacterium]|nr:ATP-binding cassette domain-containing protein [Lachnospiraceae bacterium]